MQKIFLMNGIIFVQKVRDVFIQVGILYCHIWQNFHGWDIFCDTGTSDSVMIADSKPYIIIIIIIIIIK